MDKEYEEKLEMEEHVPVPERAYIHREDLKTFGFTARCPARLSMLKKTAWQAPTENCRRRMEEELRGTVEAEAAQRWVMECLN